MIEIEKVIEICVSILGGIGVVSFWSYKAYRNSNYTYLDNLWVGMLKLYRENPRYLDREITLNYKSKLSDQELVSYNVFALTLQSTMESIYDVYGGDIPDEWIHIFRHHSNLHRAWLLNNSDSFRPKFLSFVKGA